MDFKKQIFINAITAAIFISLAALLFGRPNFSLGILLGGSASCLNFFLLYLKSKAIIKRNNPNIFLVFCNLIFRYLFMALVLWTAAKFSLDAFFAAALGLFMIRIGIYIFALQEKREQWIQQAR
ncbi:MAG: hypothetical protein COV72_07835 [Candidatus Omnitrophica bacterium CG11_big_fil_rev_8_21_14_0_20_42_13]|uniref:ATP synthase subunit I n=1 Tax=Candidatus Ghiorseimicrobium undicola TaxID=1974746 RepID=A0A2H0LVT9_9BACT|nr:MAG: hypothetical protein COV72_07835 [Candidatus Omnitrophica bacterium CG11_big_fil_rev_8_21_14_0_20_42_13]